MMILLALYGAPGLAARSGDAWEACRDRVFADLEAAGLRDYDDAGAYTGATGSGALPEVIAQCGYHPERIDRPLCDSLYQQFYGDCREDGFAGMSVAARSWVLIFDPDGPFIARLRRVCAEPAQLGRASFGRLVCAE
ncbi:hypothetical protein [uncultured Lamprocystis sp.]|uniref:hypothetical protein n=1 Tax=uncultured Lamprocystis sp. TaxID=543132 RepID=UPI0025E9D696|nr:hypothetical protein [uncultured Lamprocystis sp.]